MNDKSVIKVRPIVNGRGHSHRHHHHLHHHHQHHHHHQECINQSSINRINKLNSGNYFDGNLLLKQVS